MTTDLRSLPDITGIAPCAINPFQVQSMAATHALCAVYGIALPTMHQYTSMSSYLFPTTSFERLLAIDLLNAVLFYLDDVYDRNQRFVPLDVPTPSVYAHCGQILIDGVLPATPHPLYPIWQEVHRYFRDLSSRAYRQHLTHALMQHFQAIQISNRPFRHTTTTTHETYLATRIHDSGMIPTMLLIEFALGQPITREVYQHPMIQRATELTALIGAILNDLFSYEKEVLRLDSRFNLVRILMESEQCSFEQAVHQSVTLINQWIAEFAAIAETVHGLDIEYQQQAMAYLHGLRQQIAAAWHWQLATNRYRSPESPFPMLRTMLPERSPDHESSIG